MPSILYKWRRGEGGYRGAGGGGCNVGGCIPGGIMDTLLAHHVHAEEALLALQRLVDVRHAGRHADRQAHRQTDRQTSMQTCRHVDHTGMHAGRHVDHTGMHAGRHADRCRSADRLVCCYGDSDYIREQQPKEGKMVEVWAKAL